MGLFDFLSDPNVRLLLNYAQRQGLIGTGQPGGGQVGGGILPASGGLPVNLVPGVPPEMREFIPPSSIPPQPPSDVPVGPIPGLTQQPGPPVYTPQLDLLMRQGEAARLGVTPPSSPAPQDLTSYRLRAWPQVEEERLRQWRQRPQAWPVWGI
jgi:hypothetical protein